MHDYNLEDLVLAEILRERALTHRNEIFLEFREGQLTFGDVDETSNRIAQGLAALGVGKGDHVALMLPNCADFVHVVFALAKLGAVAVPVNTAYKGELLRHVLDTSDASTFVVDESFADLISPAVGGARGVTRVVVRATEGRPSGLDRIPAAAYPFSYLLEHGAEDPRVEVVFSEMQAIMYTSGTTGTAKGVMTPHALALTCALDNLKYMNGWGKTYYCPLPLFHAAGLWDGVMSVLISGSSIGIVERFSASRFWDDVRYFGANVSIGVFSMIPILLNQEPSPDDKDHPLETFYMGKSSLDGRFYERFGVHTAEAYTSTEAGIPTASPYGEWRTGSCGQENSERFRVAVVDEHDRELPPWVPGELVIRPRQPYVILTGYYGFWEYTANAFRNQWFHTGDRVYRDEDGYFYFLDRIKDAIRRHGENISAFDLETEVNLHPGILECAAIGVPSELEEEEVKMVIVRRPGSDPKPDEIVAFCEERLPGFMVPRYIEFVEELPRTSTDKIAKEDLRNMGDHGLTPGTWDREAASADYPPAGQDLPRRVRR